MHAHLHDTPAHALPRVRSRAQERLRAAGRSWPSATGCKTAPKKISYFSRWIPHARSPLASAEPRKFALFTVASVSGSTIYAYVANNPLLFVDPDGLILFAFDGTGNSNPPPGNDTLTNVRRFFETYNDGRAWYMNGPGRPDPDSGIGTNYGFGGETRDMANANTARDRVNFMLAQLDTYVRGATIPQGEKINIDIVGFSRGAAMGRDFANRVNTWIDQKQWGSSSSCVQLRFLGLWDSVAQFGPNGFSNTDWQLAIPATVRFTSHAVALNEHRALFPSESIGADYADEGLTRTTRGFIGSHSDIGGSYANGDLSDVALNWMHSQAKLAQVKMLDLREEFQTVSNPILHDKNTTVFGNIDTTGDRQVCQRDNNARDRDCVRQRQANYGSFSLNHGSAEQFISRTTPAADAADGSTRVGTVNMQEYAAWLKTNYQIDVKY
jgi:hypothetical protein